MSVLTDPRNVWPPQQRAGELPTHGFAVLGELAARWQQMMRTQVELETMSSQNLANAIENLSRTRSDATGSRLRLKDGERLNRRAGQATHTLGSLRERLLHGWADSIGEYDYTS